MEYDRSGITLSGPQVEAPKLPPDRLLVGRSLVRLRPVVIAVVLRL